MPDEALARGSGSRGAGIVVDGLRIDALLGAGGKGRVSRASDLRLERPVALETLPSERPKPG